MKKKKGYKMVFFPRALLVPRASPPPLRRTTPSPHRSFIDRFPGVWPSVNPRNHNTDLTLADGDYPSWTWRSMMGKRKPRTWTLDSLASCRAEMKNDGSTLFSLYRRRRDAPFSLRVGKEKTWRLRVCLKSWWQVDMPSCCFWALRIMICQVAIFD